MRKKVQLKSIVRNAPGGSPSPFSSDGFSFDPKSISVFSPVEGAKDKKPGDIFGAEALARSRAHYNRSKVLGFINEVRFHRSFRNQALKIFCYFIAPGVVVALLVLLGII